jgi:hypothetical protein
MAKPAKLYTWRDPAPLARVAVYWVYADLAFAALSLLVSVWAMGEISAYGFDESAELGLMSDLPAWLANAAEFLALLGAAFCSLKWTYRVSRNAHAVAPGMGTPPPWAIGWYFVPVASLWKPLAALVDIWRVSRAGKAGSMTPIPAFMKWWWGLWVASSVIVNLSFRLSLQAETTGDLHTVSLLDALYGLVCIPLDLLFIRLIQQITALQVANLEPIAPRASTAPVVS